MWNPFKKKDKKWIRFYSQHPGVADLNPWIPASKLQRPWVKSAIKKYYNKDTQCPYTKVKRMWTKYHSVRQGEVKAEDAMFQHAVTCPAITGIMDHGFVLVAPADILIQTDGTGDNFEWMAQLMFDSGGQTYVKAHIPEQTEFMRELVQPQRDVLNYTVKLELPWRVMAHPDVLFIQMPIPYWDEKRFTPPTGLVDPSYSFEINLQLFWHDTAPGEHIIKAGTPLCQWMPVDRSFFYSKEKDWDIVIEEMNEDDRRNNEQMDYNRYMHFMEMSSLKDRIENQKKILKLNKNNERFN